MASIMTGIELQDHFSGVLNRIVGCVNMAVSSMYDMSEAMNTSVDLTSLNSARDELAQIGAEIESINTTIESNVSGQNRINDTVAACQPKVSQVGSGFKGWEKAIVVANNALGLVKSTLGSIGIMDMSGAFDRIDTMNRFQKTITIMTGDSDVAEAALTKLNNVVLGTAYGLDVASKATQGFVTRGMSLGAATEQVRIWADAVSFYGEGTNEQLESVIDAIGKMYSKGTVEADQLDRLFDAGIGAAEIYANAVGASVSDVKESLSDGTISAAQFIETVSQAMDAGLSNGAAKNAGSTWATTFANVGAAINRGWVEIINNLDTALASHGLPSTMEMVQMFGQTVESVLNKVGSYMGLVVDLAVEIGSAMAIAGNFVEGHLDVIGPLIYGAAVAMMAYVVALGVYNMMQGISNIQEAISTIQKYNHAKAILANSAAYTEETVATASATVAQAGFNTVLAACPLTWIILLVIALIAVIAVVCSHIAKMGGTAQTAFGVFCGAVNVGLQYFKNFGLSIADVALGIWNAIKAVAGNIPIAFHNALATAKTNWYNFASYVMGCIIDIANALNKLPFVEFDVGGLQAAADNYAAKAAEAAGSKQEYNSISEAWNSGLNTFETFQDGWVSEAYKSGAEWGDGISDKVSDKLSGFTDFFNPDDALGNNMNDMLKDYSPMLGDSTLRDIAGNTGDTAGDTARIADSLDITDEDLKYLRDIAEREVIDRTVFSSVTVDMGGVTNQVNSMSDLDAIPDYLNNVLQEQISISAEG